MNRALRQMVFLLLTILCSCIFSNATNDNLSDTSEHTCQGDSFSFVINKETFNSSLTTHNGDTTRENETNTNTLSWMYYSDPQYDHLDMDYECLEFLTNKDDFHFLTFFLESEKELLISIRKYWVSWTGQDLIPGFYSLDKRSRFDGPEFRIVLIDKESGSQYQTVKGKFNLSHFKFRKCMEAELEVELQGKSGEKVTVKGKFRANYSGEYSELPEYVEFNSTVLKSLDILKAYEKSQVELRSENRKLVASLNTQKRMLTGGLIFSPLMLIASILYIRKYRKRAKDTLREKDLFVSQQMKNYDSRILQMLIVKADYQEIKAKLKEDFGIGDEDSTSGKDDKGSEGI